MELVAFGEFQDCENMYNLDHVVPEDEEVPEGATLLSC